MVAKTNYKVTTVDPFDVLQIKKVTPKPFNKNKQLSPKQQEILRKYIGLDPHSLEYGQARKLVDHQFKIWSEGLCSFKQIATLKKHGIDALNMKREEGSKYLDAIAKNGWRGLPPGFVLKKLMPRSTVNVDSSQQGSSSYIDSDDIPF